MSRTRRTLWTFAVSLASTGSSIVVGLITTPILLHYLGDARVGAFRILSEWSGYITLLDFGVGGALQVAFARACSTGDRPAIVAYVRAGARAGALLALLSIICVLGLVAASPYLVRGMSAELTWEVQLGLLVGLLGCVWSVLTAFRPLAEAGQRGYLVQTSLILQSWVMSGLSIGLAAAGCELPGQFLAIAIGNGVSAIFLAWDGLRRYPEILSRAAATVALPVTFSGSMFLFNLLSRLGLMSDGIVLGLVFGPTAVVAFTVTQRLLFLADTQVLALGTSAWAALVELHHQGRDELFNQRLIQLTRLTSVFAFLLICPLTAFTQAFVGLWVGPERYGGDLLTAFTSLYVWIHAVAAWWGWPLVATGRVRAFLPVYFVGIPINVGLKFLGSYWIGIAGPALGSAVSMLIWLGWTPMIVRREFGTPLRPLFAATFIPMIPAIPCTAAWWLLAANLPEDWFGLPVWGCWCALAVGVSLSAGSYLILTWMLVLSREERAELAERLLRFRRRSRSADAG